MRRDLDEIHIGKKVYLLALWYLGVPSFARSHYRLIVCEYATPTVAGLPCACGVTHKKKYEASRI
jgi:hypothetical protein